MFPLIGITNIYYGILFDVFDNFNELDIQFLILSSVQVKNLSQRLRKVAI